MQFTQRYENHRRYLDQINFAPTAAEKIAQPRSWERKPSTPFITRPKSRKLWKRFRTSFNSMQAQRAHTGGIALVEVELLTEINNSGNAGFLRGVKRLRLEFSGPEGFPPRNRSFVETKWELENRQKHRECCRLFLRRRSYGDCHIPALKLTCFI